MAADRGMLAEAERAGAGAIRVRIYRWRRPAVSLGRSNDATAVDEGRLASSGFALVRRPTGGGALVHGWDVSYAVAAPRRVLPAEPFAALGRRLAGPVAVALRRLGAPADWRSGSARPPTGEAVALPLCFAQRAGLDLLAGGVKLAAFAARRTRTAILVHGSVQVADLPPGTTERLADAGVGDRPGWSKALEQVVSLARVAPADPESVVAALAWAARAWGAEGLQIEANSAPVPLAEPGGA